MIKLMLILVGLLVVAGVIYLGGVRPAVDWWNESEAAKRSGLEIPYEDIQISGELEFEINKGGEDDAR